MPFIFSLSTDIVYQISQLEKEDYHSRVLNLAGNDFAALGDATIEAFFEKLLKSRENLYCRVNLSNTNLGAYPNFIKLFHAARTDHPHFGAHGGNDGLSLANNSLALWGANQLAEFLKPIPYSIHIVLTGEKLHLLNKSGELAEVLAAIKSRRLSLGNNQLGLLPPELLKEGLASVNDFTHRVDLENNNFGLCMPAEGLKFVVSNLNPSIESLSLTWNQLDRYTIEEFTEIFTAIPDTVKFLYLQGNWQSNLAPEKIAALKELFAASKKSIFVEDFLSPVSQESCHLPEEKNPQAPLSGEQIHQDLSVSWRYLQDQSEWNAKDSLYETIQISLAYFTIQLSHTQANPSYLPKREFDFAKELAARIPLNHEMRPKIMKHCKSIHTYLCERDPENQQHYTTLLPSEGTSKNLPQQKIIRETPLEEIVRNRSDIQTKLYSDCVQIIMNSEHPFQELDAHSILSRGNEDASSPNENTFFSIKTLLNHFYLGYLNEELINFILDIYITKHELPIQAIKQIFFIAMAIVCNRDNDCFKPNKLKFCLFLLIYCDTHLKPHELEQVLHSTTFNPFVYNDFWESGAKCFRYVKNIMFRKTDGQVSKLGYYLIDKKILCDFEQWYLMYSRRLNPTECFNPDLFLPFFLKTNSSFETIKQEFKSFVELYDRVNYKASAEHQYDRFLFFLQYGSQSELLVQVMGADGIALMRKQLAYTVLPLKRLLDKLPHRLDEEITKVIKKCFDTLSQHTKKTPEFCHSFYLSLVCINILCSMYGLPTDEYEDHESMYSALRSAKSVDELLYSLATLVTKNIFQNLGSDNLAFQAEKNITSLFDKVSVEYFAELAKASLNMAEDNYKEVFLNLLKRYLLDGNVDDYLHNPNQENQSGREISLHNQHIQQELKDAGIVPAHALNFKPIYSFEIDCSTQTNDNASLLLWASLEKLQQAVSDCQKEAVLVPSYGEHLTKMQQLLNKLFAHEVKDEDTKTLAQILDKESSQSQIAQLIKLNKKVQSQRADQASESLDCLNKCSKEVDDAIKDKKKCARTKKDSQFFTVELWKKSNADTFLLGKYVSCCLAPDGGSFNAMNQRCMDDAFTIPVVKDAFGNTIALYWQYLAKMPNGSIVLIGNFPEVHTLYGNNPKLRVGIFHGLLKFIDCYLKANPEIKHFYMMPPTYGYNKSDLEHFDFVQVAPGFDKLGGPYRPSSMDHDDQLSTSDQYYLVSLDKRKFRLFDREILAKNAPDYFKNFCVKPEPKPNETLSEPTNTTPQNEFKAAMPGLMDMGILAQPKIQLEPQQNTASNNWGCFCVVS